MQPSRSRRSALLIVILASSGTGALAAAGCSSDPLFIDPGVGSERDAGGGAIDAEGVDAKASGDLGDAAARDSGKDSGKKDGASATDADSTDALLTVTDAHADGATTHVDAAASSDAGTDAPNWPAQDCAPWDVQQPPCIGIGGTVLYCVSKSDAGKCTSAGYKVGSRRYACSSCNDCIGADVEAYYQCHSPDGGP